MNDEKLQELGIRIGKLCFEILGPLRLSKTLNESKLQELNLALNELEAVLEMEEKVSKAFVGNLWFIFTSMLSEAEYAKNNRQDIEAAAWAIGEKLRKIFGPRF